MVICSGFVRILVLTACVIMAPAGAYASGAPEGSVVEPAPEVETAPMVVTDPVEVTTPVVVTTPSESEGYLESVWKTMEEAHDRLEQDHVESERVHHVARVDRSAREPAVAQLRVASHEAALTRDRREVRRGRGDLRTRLVQNHGWRQDLDQSWANEGSRGGRRGD